MRDVYLLLLLALPAGAALNALWFGRELRHFADETPRLESTADLQRFRRVVGRQMYAALVQILLLALPPIIFFYGLTRKILTVGDLLLVVLPAAAIIVLAQLNRRHETRVRSIPAADPELERERDRIVRTWNRRPLPDW